jgi:hypothetical protein
MSGDEVGPKAKGGFARAQALTPEQRTEIAKKAALSRWGNNPTRSAVREGELKIAGNSIPCAVLDDGTRVLSRAGFIRAIGRKGKAKGGRLYDDESKTPVFLTAANLKLHVPEDLSSNSDPIPYTRVEGGTVAMGYRAELLPQVCGVFIDAKEAGDLRPNQLHIYEKCKVLFRGFATVGITALIDEATGYQDIRPRDALAAYLEKLIRKELAAWAKKFPDEFYENIYKLKGWPWPGMQKNRYSVVAHYTRDLVYERIAPGLLRELEAKSPLNERGYRPHKLHQWLTDEIGNPMLAQHLHSVIMLQRLALTSGYGWHRFLKTVDKVMPRRGDTLLLPFTESETDSNFTDLR